jgi:predicted  nucleic acid-binding Zn-ribbon protein
VSELETLVSLQAVDADLDARRTRLTEIKTALADTAEVREARRAFEAARTRLHDDEAKQRQLEWEVDDRSSKIKELETKLYSGKIGNPKELAGLQTEIQHLRADLGAVEERAIEAINATDEARAETARLEAELARAETKAADDKSHLREEQVVLDKAVAELQPKRDAIAAGIGRLAMAKYEELRRIRAGQAVARIERNMCMGCRTTLPTAHVQSARQGNLAYCSACGRILYFVR